MGIWRFEPLDQLAYTLEINDDYFIAYRVDSHYSTDNTPEKNVPPVMTVIVDPAQGSNRCECEGEDLPHDFPKPRAPTTLL